MLKYFRKLPVNGRFCYNCLLFVITKYKQLLHSLKFKFNFLTYFNVQSISNIMKVFVHFT
jgi:hypothetical protein